MAMSMSTKASTESCPDYTRIYGLRPGPYSVGVTTTQFTDLQRPDPGDSTKKRGLQTEIWYPCCNKDADDTPPTSINKYSDFLGLSTLPNDETRKEALKIANSEKCFGGYRDGLTIEELDDPMRTTWMNQAIRNAEPYKNKDSTDSNDQLLFPLVVFSHGSGAYRASYIYWCEFLASHGYVVAAPDHPGSARFTIVDGKVIVPDDGPRSKRKSMEQERPLDIRTVIDGLSNAAAASSNSIVQELPVDCQTVAVTGMSFGGYTTAAYLEQEDPRVKAAVMQCPSIAKSGSRSLHLTNRKNKYTPVMIMLGTEDTVIGLEGNDAARLYAENHLGGPSYLFEIKRGGHVSFTSCELYDVDYGNGIGATKECPSSTRPGESYMPLDIVQQHRMINSYGLAFLNTYLKNNNKDEGTLYNLAYLKENHFPEDHELIYKPTKEQ